MKKQGPRIKNVIRKKRPQAEKSRYYIDKKEYTEELMKYIKSGVASEKLGELFKRHVDHYASGASFKNYTYLDEMKSEALLFLIKYSKGFKIDVGRDAFAYCTTIIHNAFLQSINREKKHSFIKDSLIKNQRKLEGNPPKSSVFDTMQVD
jgi:DNA-directed RNA polymerase specialized sigma24 family protein